MKEIGEKLREARESMGISIEEAAEDLKLRPSQIENIEEGNMEAFKDIFYLKYFIRDYSKYLGLDKDDMVDEFNEYLFDYTSKISLEDIKNARKEGKKEGGSKGKKKGRWGFYIPPIIIYLLIIGLISLIIYFAITIMHSNEDDFVDGNEIAFVGGGIYEFTK